MYVTTGMRQARKTGSRVALNSLSILKREDASHLEGVLYPGDGSYR